MLLQAQLYSLRNGFYELVPGLIKSLLIHRFRVDEMMND